MLGDIAGAEAQHPAADPMHSGNQVEQRGLAGAVGADQAVHASAPHRKINGIDGQEAAEAACHAARLEQPRVVLRGGAHGAASLRGGSLSAKRVDTSPTRRTNVAQSAASPPSPNSMGAIKIAPNTRIRDAPIARKSAGKPPTTAAPRMAPARLPTPPITTMMRISIDFQNMKSFGAR